MWIILAILAQNNVKSYALFSLLNHAPVRSHFVFQNFSDINLKFMFELLWKVTQKNSREGIIFSDDDEVWIDEKIDVYPVLNAKLVFKNNLDNNLFHFLKKSLENYSLYRDEIRILLRKFVFLYFDRDFSLLNYNFGSTHPHESFLTDIKNKVCNKKDFYSDDFFLKANIYAFDYCFEKKEFHSLDARLNLLKNFKDQLFYQERALLAHLSKRNPDIEVAVFAFLNFNHSHPFISKKICETFNNVSLFHFLKKYPNYPLEDSLMKLLEGCDLKRIAFEFRNSSRPKFIAVGIEASLKSKSYLDIYFKKNKKKVKKIFFKLFKKSLDNSHLSYVKNFFSFSVKDKKKISYLYEQKSKSIMSKEMELSFPYVLDVPKIFLDSSIELDPIMKLYD